MGFAVAVNAQQFSLDGTRFYYFPPPRLSAVLPSSGSSAGGTIVTLHGSNFDSVATHTLCSFAIGGRLQLPLNGQQWSALPDVVDATRYSDSEMRCQAPRAVFHREVVRPNVTYPPPPMAPPMPNISAAYSTPATMLNGTGVNASFDAAGSGEAGSGSGEMAPGSGEADSGEVGSGSVSGESGSGSGETGSGSGDIGAGSGELGSGSGEYGSGDIGSGSGDFGWLDERNETNITYITAALANVEVTLNGRQFAFPGTPFTYFGTPVVSHFSPACGPTRGTVRTDRQSHSETSRV